MREVAGVASPDKCSGPLPVTAAFPGQELQTNASTGVTYWEGSVVVASGDLPQSVTGRGYLEMTGYTGKSMGAVFGVE